MTQPGSLARPTRCAPENAPGNAHSASFGVATSRSSLTWSTGKGAGGLLAPIKSVATATHTHTHTGHSPKRLCCPKQSEDMYHECISTKLKNTKLNRISEEHVHADVSKSPGTTSERAESREAFVTCRTAGSGRTAAAAPSLSQMTPTGSACSPVGKLLHN